METDFEKFLEAYIVTALFNTLDSLDEPLENHYGKADIETFTLDKMADDCRKFIAISKEELTLAYSTNPDFDSSKAGADFWLARSRESEGFTDRNLGTTGHYLRYHAQLFSEFQLTVDNDDKVCC